MKDVCSEVLPSHKKDKITSFQQGNVKVNYMYQHICVCTILCMNYFVRVHVYTWFDVWLLCTAAFSFILSLNLPVYLVCDAWLRCFGCFVLYM